MNNSSTNLTLIKAKSYAGKGKMDEACQLYFRILERFPQNKSANDGLLRIHETLAIDYKKELVSLFTQGKLDMAIDKAKLLTKKFTHSAEIWGILGSSLLCQGNFKEAIEGYRQALRIKPDYVEVYCNIGDALKGNGDLQEAIKHYKQAITIMPDNANVYNNIGTVLIAVGDTDKAINNFKQAIAIKPDLLEAYNNLGNALCSKNDLNAGIKIYKQAILLQPNCAELLNNMGVALQSNNDLENAINSYAKAIRLRFDFDEAYFNMGLALKNVIFTTPNTDVQKIIVSILNKKTYVKPKDILKASISLLKSDFSIENVIKNFSTKKPGQLIQEVVQVLTNIPLLLKLMSVCPIADPELEVIFRKVRNVLLLSVNKTVFSEEILLFLSTLGLQCFINEFVYSENEKETKAIEELEFLISEILSKGQQPNPQFILCLASYKALHEYEWISFLRINNNIADVFTMHVMEPMQEKKIKTYIPVLENITNKVSSNVRAQYEINPYPRWINTCLTLKPLSISGVINEVDLRTFNKKINDIKNPNILIGGCGTGEHSTNSAIRFQNSNVLAIDLSLSSLAYAKRKTEEFNLKNIEYLQADILNIEKLKRQFDIVESVGVLHHMDNPIEGWEKLTDCLKPGGLMKIGLYSQLARQDIEKIRKKIEKLNFKIDDVAMKVFRDELINSGKENYKYIMQSPDFYCLSSLRDLIFHVQEHRFTLPQIKDCLSRLGLKFCGFESNEILKSFKLINSGVNDPYDLDKWSFYEKNNPLTFSNMYQFWCQKI